METDKKTYFEYLDALRCLAFLAVFYAHTGTIFTGAIVDNNLFTNIWRHTTVYGSYGVNFFFTLSGFLITYLLLKEKQKNGCISIKKFYLRRILRIWPVYFTTLLFSILILPFIIPPETFNIFPMTNPNMNWETISYYLFFLGNIYQGLGFGIASLSIGILWSVCVEEQFYLVWPWFVKVFNTRTLIFVTSLLISLSLLYKFIWAEDRLGNYYLPWSVGMDLAFGAMLGIFYFINRKREIILGSVLISLSSFIIISLAFFISNMNTPALIEILRLFKTPFISSIFVLILVFFIDRNNIININNQNRLTKYLSGAGVNIKNILTYLGQISYGLYAYHTICLMIMVHILYSIGFLKTNVNMIMFFTTIISSFILTICVANLSYLIIEKKMLGLKNKFK